MDTLKRLSLEINGICGAISNYTGEPYIGNVITQLQLSVENQSLEDIKYLLNELKLWFEKHQQEIQFNNFVINKTMYLDIQEKINNYLNELKNYNSQPIQKNNNEQKDEQVKKIFISHASKDKVICNAFVELLEGIGIPESMILYSSSPRHGIPGDMDIFEYLRSHLADGITVYYMLSDNYYQSVYCLNEMGAAWVTQNDFSTFLLPNFTQSIDGVIDNKKKAYSLNNPVELVYLKNKLIEEFTVDVSDAKWEDIKNKFLEVVRAELQSFKEQKALEMRQDIEQEIASEQELRDKILHEFELEKMKVTVDKQAELYEKNAQIDVTKQIFEQILAGNTDILQTLEQFNSPNKIGSKINNHPANKKRRR